MDFFEKMGEELTNMGNDIVRVTKEAADNAKLHGVIMSENSKINEQLRMIGERVYQDYKDDPEKINELGEGMEVHFKRIRKSEEKIIDAKDSLIKNKGAIGCPDCGATIPKGSSFCNRCGKTL